MSDQLEARRALQAMLGVDPAQSEELIEPMSDDEIGLVISASFLEQSEAAPRMIELVTMARDRQIGRCIKQAERLLDTVDLMDNEAIRQAVESYRSARANQESQVVANIQLAQQLYESAAVVAG